MKEGKPERPEGQQATLAQQRPGEVPFTSTQSDAPACGVAGWSAHNVPEIGLGHFQST